MHPKYDNNFMKSATQMMVNHMETTVSGKNKVTHNKLPQELRSIIDFQIGEKPQKPEQLIEKCKKVLEYSVKVHNPGFHNQLYGGFDQYAMLGALMTPIANNAMYTYQMSPCFTLMETQFYQYFRKILQWDRIDGTMCPGGSLSNIMGMQCARAYAFPEVKLEGSQNLPTMKVIAGQVTHYSVKKSAILLGIGLNNVLLTKSDQSGRMDVLSLQQTIVTSIQNGCKPFMVTAIIGTTVEGAIDDIQRIAQVCEEHKIWLHVDACYGGGFIISKKLRERIGSMKKVDSVALNAHKVFPVSQQASFFLCKHPGVMYQANSLDADYLFHKQRLSYSNNLDQGNKIFQCGRVADILKVWTYYKGNGIEGVQADIERRIELVNTLRNHIDKNKQRFMYAIPQSDSFNVCFYYIPKQLKKEDWSQQEFMEILGKIPVMGKKFMLEEGKIMIGYSSTKGMKYFWRFVVTNPHETKEQIIEHLNLIVKYSEQAYSVIQKQLNPQK